MNVKLKKYLTKCNLTDNEIKDLKFIAPMIDDIEFEVFEKNCKTLIDFGYPKVDLSFLINANPNIFVLPNQELVKDLKSLSKQYDNIELALKNNPFLI